MSTTPQNGSTKRQATTDVHYFVTHDSFELSDAEAIYGPTRRDDQEFAATHMPDDVTRDFARRMHYAGLAAVAHNRLPPAGLLEVRILLVPRSGGVGQPQTDLPGGGSLDAGGDVGGRHDRRLPDRAHPGGGGVQPVARHPLQHLRLHLPDAALSRLSQRHAADRLSKSLPLESLPDGEPRDLSTVEPSVGRMQRIDEYLARATNCCRRGKSRCCCVGSASTSGQKLARWSRSGGNWGCRRSAFGRCRPAPSASCGRSCGTGRRRID